MDPETRSSTGTEVVVAYFASTSDAQSALDDLIYEGFEPRQIGAAFRGGSAVTHAAATLDEGEPGSKTVHNALDSDTVGSGPASDTRAVTPAGLSTGGGSVISGASRPGPIPGSDIPHHRSKAPASMQPSAAEPLPATGGFHEKFEEDGWWQKLKNFFSGDTRTEPRKGPVTDSSMNFGTGEGHLATYPENYEYAYSTSAFESAFSGMGIVQTRAHSLAGNLRQGGAVISVEATGRLDDAERVLERNHGQLRYEAVAEPVQWSDIPGEKVRVLGHLSRTYPTYLTRSDIPSRKAS
jgi:hypothetical protein